MSQLGSARSGETGADIDAVAVIVAETETEGVASGTHGAEDNEQDGALLKILLIQQLSAPPGNSAHMRPPHRPHELAQQAVPRAFDPNIPFSQRGSASDAEELDGETVIDGDAVGEERTQGGPFVSQETPLRIMRPIQHEIAPPGRESQPEPPQVPHLLAQQTSRVPAKFKALIPVSQSGSARNVGLGES